MTDKPISLFDSVEPEVMERIVERGTDIAHGAPVNSKIAAALALGSVPIALGALAKDVYGQTPGMITDVLEFALTLEYLENRFYSNGLAATGLLTGVDRTVFAQIQQHEQDHVTFLQTALGASAPTEPTFFFTTVFPDVFTNIETFRAVAQALEDTGVRAYKGQVGALMSDKDVLTAALSIHAVEAEHASRVRRLRGQKGWITGNDRGGLPASLQAVYDGEQNEVQGSVTLSSLPSYAASGGSAGATEAFDEPLTREQVLAIVAPFLTGPV